MHCQRKHFIGASNMNAHTELRTIHPFVRVLFEAIDSGDWPSLRRLCDQQVTYERPGYAPLIGITELMHFYTDVRIIREGRHHVESVAADGDALCYNGRFIGTTKGGQPIDIGFCDFCHLRDGKLLHRKTYFGVPAV